MTGIHHVALPTRRQDVEAEVAFWALLGFSVVEAPPSLRERATWVQAPDGTQIHLLYADEPEPRGGHTAIVAPAFEATLTALAAAGHPPEPRTPHWGASRAYVHSPSGHLIELMAAPPPIA
ncbi:VOC family protein [Baekduia sp.]|uniref:VOC family protein n=1 Tax=Baekduia sp. TaxID=2600305 RepID=UPI002DFE3232|nr:VOC family protein [Baekduia sp.]